MNVVKSGNDKQVRVGLWNIEWAKAKSRRAAKICQHLNDMAPDILCLCEAYSGFWAEHGHWIDCYKDYGYNIQTGRRKVLLWSKQPWQDVDIIGDKALPTGRFVSGTTQTPLGLAKIIGVCIPWSHAHVQTGNRNRRAWEDHEQYLHGLSRIVKNCDPTMPTLIVGDFNQRLPRGRAPARLHELLSNALGDDFSVVTQGDIDGLDQLPVCHVAATQHFRCSRIQSISRVADELCLSDHDGLLVNLGKTRTAKSDDNFAGTGHRTRT